MSAAPRIGVLKALAFFMFAMFAMTTDSVGVIIPQVIRRYGLGMTAGGAFQYATMSGIAIAAFGLGFLADRWGRKRSIVAGLLLFAVSMALFAVGRDFPVFVALLFCSGLAIGVFKAGALARTRSPRLGTPEDIAGTVAMLASDDGAWINDQILSVDGGTTMR